MFIKGKVGFNELDHYSWDHSISANMLFVVQFLIDFVDGFKLTCQSYPTLHINGKVREEILQNCGAYLLTALQKSIVSLGFKVNL